MNRRYYRAKNGVLLNDICGIYLKTVDIESVIDSLNSDLNSPFDEVRQTALYWFDKISSLEVEK